AQAGARLVVRPLGRARVAGRKEPVEVHELLGLAGEALPIAAPALERFQRARSSFVARRFRDAAADFREVRELRGGRDGPSEVYLRLIDRFEEEPRGDGWDGVLTFESK